MFFFWWSVYLGKQSLLSCFSQEKLGGKHQPLCWRGSCHYRCRSVLAVQSGTEAFEAKGLYRETVISLTQGEPDSQLSPLKIGFLSPKIKIRLSPLHWGSIRKTCRPLRPWEARSADRVVISVTFDLLGPAATLIPYRGGFPPGVCLTARQAWPRPTAGVIHLTWLHPLLHPA